jgi:UDP-GlcNAc3NAcA epimerase
MPEEINRVLTDHLSNLLLAPSSAAQENLAREGIDSGVYLVGDVMYDAAMEHRQIAKESSNVLALMELSEKEYILATVHRAENTDAPERIGGIARAFRELCRSEKIVWPVHPRTQRHLEDLGLKCVDNLHLIEPASYLDMLQLEAHARVVLTDSGGVQKEAQWFEVPCVTLRDETEWIETVTTGWNQLAGTESSAIVEAVRRARRPETLPSYRTPGTARAIVNLLVDTANYSSRPTLG